MAAAAQEQGTAQDANTIVLKVQCKHGSVQIRQGMESNFVELMSKFRAHAVKRQWMTAKQKCVLQVDGDAVDPEDGTPEELDLEDDMVVDVKIS